MGGDHELHMIPCVEEISDKRRQSRWMYVVFRLLDPDQVRSWFCKKRRHQRQHAEGPAGHSHLMDGILKSRLLLDEIKPAL